MKIGIDARFLTHPQAGGFKTYTENLITALAAVDKENEYILYLDRSPAPEANIPYQPNFASRIVPGQLPVIGMPWREQVGLAWQVHRDKPDLFHAPCLTAPIQLGCPLIVTIHDMIWLFPEKFRQGNSLSFQRKLMEWYNLAVPKLISRRAASIFTVSEAAKESIVQHLGVPADQIFVTYEAPNPIYQAVNGRVHTETIQQTRQLPAEFILAIGSADPRKNMITLLNAYASLSPALREQYKLVIVWTHNFLAAEMAEKVEQLGLNNQVQFLQQVSNEELVLLYNAASLFVFPSLYEGFGLPLLEAMACGTAVVAANNSSIPEIAADAALYFQAEDAEGMTNVMTEVLTNESLRLDLADKGHKRVNTFSWEKCARQTLQGYQRAVKTMSIPT